MANNGSYYKPPSRRGDPFFTCDKTGFTVPRSQTQKQWDGTIVWDKYWEPRQPQDLIAGCKDTIAVPDGRPSPPDVFIGYNQVKREDL